MARFDTILWDVDGTLLDFGAAEEAAMRALMRSNRAICARV